MTDEQISTAASQWAQGAQIIEIGHYLGISRWQAMRVMELYRHMFPSGTCATASMAPRQTGHEIAAALSMKLQSKSKLAQAKWRGSQNQAPPSLSQEYPLSRARGVCDVVTI